MGRWVRSLFERFGRPMDPPIARLYLQGLQHIPVPFLESVLEELLERQDSAPAELPGLDEFVSRWKRHQLERVNPERVDLHEVKKMREQIQAAVALRISGLSNLPPIEDMAVPEFARNIVRRLVANFHTDYPDGLPPPPRLQELVASYQRRAGKLYDDELANQFDLSAPK